MAAKSKSKSKSKTTTKQVVKAKTAPKKSTVKAKKPVTTKKPAPKATKAVATKKPVAKVTKKIAPKAVAKKPVPKKPIAKKPVKAAAKAPTPAKAPAKVAAKAPVKTATKAATKVVAKAAPAPKAASTRKKKPTKMDKKMARILVKIANAQNTAMANVGVKSAVLAAMKATVAMSAANHAHHPQQPANLPAAANANAAPAKTAEKPAFKAGDMVVYPAHGVGKVEGIEAHTVGGMEVKLFKITFEHERMTLKVPMQRATGSGLRQLSSKETMKNVFETMKGRPRIRRVMWSRRAQEYEQKINSGDPVAIAEVLRDLRRNAESGEQSYSERQIFNNALERLAREVAAIEKIEQDKAVEKLHNLLVRSKPAATAANDDAAEDAA